MPDPIEWMQLAYELAQQAQEEGEVPVGAVVVSDDKLIATGYNQSIMLNDPSAHAEIIALRNAGKVLGNYRLTQCQLYVTLEPCCMCAGAIVQSRISHLYYGADDQKSGAVNSVFQLLSGKQLNHRVDVQAGFLEQQCSNQLKHFFKAKRKKQVS